MEIPLKFILTIKKKHIPKNNKRDFKNRLNRSTRGKLVSYCQGAVMGFWGQQWLLGEAECWALWGGRAAGFSARPGSWSSLRPVCPAQSLHTHGTIRRSVYRSPLHHNGSVLSHLSMEWAHSPPSSSFPSFMQLDRLAMEERVLGSSESISPGPAFMSVEGKHAGTTCGQRTGTDLEDGSWTFDSMGTLFINNNLF